MKLRLFIAALIALLLLALGYVFVAAPMSSTPPSYDFTKLEGNIASMVTDNGLKGAALIVYKDGQPIFSKSFGDEFDIHTPVTIGSASKWVTAATILTLVDEQKMQLDQPLFDFLPSLSGLQKEKITLRQALTHTAGMNAKHDCLRQYKRSLRHCADAIAKSPLGIKPGRAFAYGSLSYQVAAAAAEEAAGTPFRDLFQARIAQPLGMTHSRFGRKGLSSNPNVAGNLNSSASDFIKFLEAMRKEQQADVLSPAMKVEMSKGQSGAGQRALHVPERHLNSKYKIYGLGMWREVVQPDGSPLVISSPGKFGFIPWIDKRHNLTAVLSTEFSQTQLEQNKPPDPSDLIFAVCAIVDKAERGIPANANPDCKRRGAQTWPATN